MLFLAVTRKRLTTVPAEWSSTISNKWVVTSGVSGHLSELKSSRQHIQLSEHCNRKLPSSSCLAAIDVDLAHSRLAIHCPTIGGRAIYYHQDSHGQFFCSTHIEKLRQVGISILENQEFLPEYFIYRCVMPPNTMFQGIHQVTLGGSVQVVFNSLHLDVQQHFFQPPKSIPEKQLVETAKQIKERIANVVRINTSKDSKVLMSGGIDSSLVFKLAQNQPGITHSYASAYPFEKADLDIESQYATSAAKIFGSNHKQFSPSTSRYRQAVIASIASAELPLHHLQSPLMYLLCKDCFAGSDEPVVNSIGAGGTFGNFRNFLYLRRQPLFRALNNPVGQGLLQFVNMMTGKGQYRIDIFKTAQAAKNPPVHDDSIWRWHAYGDIQWVKRRLKADWNSVISGPDSVMKKYYSLEMEDIWALYSLLGDETATINVWSKLAESCGQTMLFPMYDNEVLELALELSWSEKLARPENGLRTTVADLAGVPGEIIDRPKSGFGVQRLDWALVGGPFEPLVPLAAKAVDIDWITELQCQNRQSAMTFWILLNYGIWKRIVIDQEPVENLFLELENAERTHKVC